MLPNWCRGTSVGAWPCVADGYATEVAIESKCILSRRMYLWSGGPILCYLACCPVQQTNREVSADVSPCTSFKHFSSMFTHVPINSTTEILETSASFQVGVIHCKRYFEGPYIQRQLFNGSNSKEPPPEMTFQTTQLSSTHTMNHVVHTLLHEYRAILFTMGHNSKMYLEAKLIMHISCKLVPRIIQVSCSPTKTAMK